MVLEKLSGWINSLTADRSKVNPSGPTWSVGKRVAEDSSSSSVKRFKQTWKNNTTGLTTGIVGYKLSKLQSSPRFDGWQYNIALGSAENFVKGRDKSPSSPFDVDSPRMFKSIARKHDCAPPPLIDLETEDDEDCTVVERKSNDRPNKLGMTQKSAPSRSGPMALGSRENLQRMSTYNRLVISSCRTDPPVVSQLSSSFKRPVGQSLNPEKSLPFRPTPESTRTVGRPPVSKFWDKHTPAKSAVPVVVEISETGPSLSRPPNAHQSCYNQKSWQGSVSQSAAKQAPHPLTKRPLQNVINPNDEEEKRRLQEVLWLSSATQSNYGYKPNIDHLRLGPQSYNEQYSHAMMGPTIHNASSSFLHHDASVDHSRVFRTTRTPKPPFGELRRRSTGAVPSTDIFYTRQRCAAALREIDLDVTPISSRSRSPEVVVLSPTPSKSVAIDVPNGDSRYLSTVSEESQSETLSSASSSRNDMPIQKAERKFFDEERLAQHRQRLTMDPSRLTRTIRTENLEKSPSELQHYQMELDLRQKARLTEMRSKEEDLIQKLKAEHLFFPEPESAEPDELAALSEEQEEVVSNALKCRNRTTVLVEEFSIPIKRGDLATLEDQEWLNDEVINFYFNLIMTRSKTNKNLPTCYAFNTFFLTKLQTSGYSLVKRWTKKVDIFSYDLLFIPVHLGSHWCLAVVDFRSKVASYYDSLGGSNEAALKTLLQYLHDESMDKKKQKFDTFDWKTVNRKDVPQQNNGSDCGMFSCKFAEYVSRDAKITFTQKNMPYFRRRMIYEILSKSLM